MNITREQYEADIREAKELAWDEGEAAGFDAGQGLPTRSNPYRDNA